MWRGFGEFLYWEMCDARMGIGGETCKGDMGFGGHDGKWEVIRDSECVCGAITRFVVLRS
jgi:hypothetical protein